MPEQNRPAISSDPNVGRVLELYEAFNARDFDRLVALYDENVDILSFAAEVGGGRPYQGHAGVREWYENLVGTFDMVIEPGALLPYRRLVLSIPTVYVKVGADLESSYEQGILYAIPHGLITRSLGYKDVSSALQAMARILEGGDPLSEA
jgi:hypothetical protein